MTDKEKPKDNTPAPKKAASPKQDNAQVAFLKGELLTANRRLDQAGENLLRAQDSVDSLIIFRDALQEKLKQIS